MSDPTPPEVAAKMARAELKPCPHCGGEAHLQGVGYVGPADVYDVYVECSACYARGETMDVDLTENGDEDGAAEDAIRTWNTRARDASMVAEVERYRAVIAHAAEQFEFYARLHAAKGTPDADAKSIVNRALAETMRAALKERPDAQ